MKEVMKEVMGEILNGVKNVIVGRTGEDSFKSILFKYGITDLSIFSSPENASANTLIEVLDNLCSTLNMTLYDTAEAYGEYWGQYCLPKMAPYFGRDVKDSRSCLLKLNEIHFSSAPENKVSPLLHCSWKDHDTVMLTFTGYGGLKKMPYFFFKGIVSGMAKYYHENLQVFTSPLNSMIILFPKTSTRRQIGEHLTPLGPRLCSKTAN